MTRLLADLGIHMGSWLSRDAESVHFQRLNRRIYATTGSKWGEIDSLLQAMRSEEFIDQQVDAMRQGLFYERPFPRRKPVIVDYFGSDLWTKLCRDQYISWGWKDPRTALTYPIWLRLFPQAYWVHIVRNGIDVAISVHRRSLKQRRRVKSRLLPLDYSPRTLDFGYSFHLWQVYVSFITEYRVLLPPERYLEIRYEDLLENPEEELRQLATFANYPLQEDLLRSALQRIDSGRLDNSVYAAAYADEIPRLAGSPLMKKFGYTYSV
jgi:hypothetical protein